MLSIKKPAHESGWQVREQGIVLCAVELFDEANEFAITGANEGTAFDRQFFDIHADVDRNAVLFAEANGANDVDEVRRIVVSVLECFHHGCAFCHVGGIQVHGNDGSWNEGAQLTEVRDRVLNVSNGIIVAHFHNRLEHEVALQSEVVVGEALCQLFEFRQAQVFVKDLVADALVKGFHTDRDFESRNLVAFFKDTGQENQFFIIHISWTRFECQDFHVRQMRVAFGNEVDERRRRKRFLIQNGSLVAHDHFLYFMGTRKNIRFLKKVVRLLCDVLEADVME